MKPVLRNARFRSRHAAGFGTFWGSKKAWTTPFLVPLRGQNRNSRRASPTFSYGSSPLSPGKWTFLKKQKAFDQFSSPHTFRKIQYPSDVTRPVAPTTLACRYSRIPSAVTILFVSDGTECVRRLRPFVLLFSIFSCCDYRWPTKLQWCLETRWYPLARGFGSESLSMRILCKSLMSWLPPKRFRGKPFLFLCLLCLCFPTPQGSNVDLRFVNNGISLISGIFAHSLAIKSNPSRIPTTALSSFNLLKGYSRFDKDWPHTKQHIVIRLCERRLCSA